MSLFFGMFYFILFEFVGWSWFLVKCEKRKQTNQRLGKDKGSGNMYVVKEDNRR